MKSPPEADSLLGAFSDPDGKNEDIDDFIDQKEAVGPQ